MNKDKLRDTARRMGAFMKKNTVRKFLPVVIIIFAILIMFLLIKSRPTPEKAEPSYSGMLVQTEQIYSSTLEVTVTGTATVRAEHEVSVIPQASGTVKSIAKGFAEGGFFKKGDVLLRLDDSDYKLALSQALASEARAEYELEQIKSRADIARREWKIISRITAPSGKDPDSETSASSDNEQPNPLVLYAPQLKNAQASLQSASAMVDLARLNLDRTTVRAPFDCRVRTKSVDTGQYVRTGTVVAVLASTGAAEVVVPMERQELGWLSIPGPGQTGVGSVAYITIPGDPTGASWQGHVVRSLGEVDMKSRTVQVAVTVDDPYGLKRENRGHAPLMSGSFVNVRIAGRKLDGVFSIPRATLRDDDTVWLLDEQSTLKIAKVNVVRIEGDRVIVDKGLMDGQRLVLTKISGAADGMKLRDMDANNDTVRNISVNSPVGASGSPEAKTPPSSMEQSR